MLVNDGIKGWGWFIFTAILFGHKAGTTTPTKQVLTPPPPFL